MQVNPTSRYENRQLCTCICYGFYYDISPVLKFIEKGNWLTDGVNSLLLAFKPISRRQALNSSKTLNSS